MKLEICAIVKNEARYIAEWLEYHLMIGFDHIDLYDNGSEDALLDVCSRFDAVRVIPWPKRGGQQRTAYQHYLRRNRTSDIWSAFIDADEFIYDATGANIKRYLAALPQHVGGVEMPWVIFDCNGHDKRPDGLVVENYTRAHSVAPQQNVKTLCRPGRVDVEKISSPHSFPYNEGFSARRATEIEMPLFHYMLRSREDVVLKVTRGDVWSVETERKRLADVTRAVKSILDKYDNADRIENRMLKYAPMLRERLSRRSILQVGHPA